MANTCSSWAKGASHVAKQLALAVAIVSALSTLAGAGWSLIEFAKATREQARVARISQLTTYASFGELLKRYHVIEKSTDGFMRQHRTPDWDLSALLKQYQTGASVYYSQELSEFRDIHQFYEELGTLIRFNAVDFELVFQVITFPSDFQDTTRQLQQFLADHWFELRSDPRSRVLTDFGFNLAELERNYEAHRRGNPVAWTEP